MVTNTGHFRCCKAGTGAVVLEDEWSENGFSRWFRGTVPGRNANSIRISVRKQVYLHVSPRSQSSP